MPARQLRHWSAPRLLAASARFFADDDAAVPERRVFDSEFPRKVDGLHLAAEDHSRRRYLELVIATLPLLGDIECLSFLGWCLGKLVRSKGLAA